MPKYTKSRGRKKLVKKKKRFRHPYEVLHALSSTRPEDFEHYRELAKDYLSGEKVPPVALSRESLAQLVTENQQFLTQQAAHEFHDGDGGGLGGGIASATAVIGQEISHLVGADAFMDWIGHINKPKKYPGYEAQVASFLTDMTYKDIGERPDLALMYERLPRFDTEHCSVWRNRNTDELMVCINGTKLKPSDLKQDLEILMGSVNVEDVEFKGVLDKLQKEYPNQKYDLSAHSLGCVFAMHEAGNYGSNWDDTYMFNAPSSPAQDDDVLRDWVNNYGLTFYSSTGDVLGQNTNYMFNNETLDERVYWANWKWDPLSSHSLSQWYPENFHTAKPNSTRIDNQESTMDTAVHAQDTKVSQAENLS